MSSSLSQDTIGVVPLLVTDGDPSLAERVAKAGGDELTAALASAIEGEIIPEQLIERVLHAGTLFGDETWFARPCVFLLFFDEHAPLSCLQSRALEMCHAHVASIPVYCYLNSVGIVPFKIRLEEIHGLNYGRPFLSLSLSGNWRAALPDVTRQVTALASEAIPFIGGLISSAQPNVFAPGGSLFRLPYLRIFRE